MRQLIIIIYILYIYIFFIDSFINFFVDFKLWKKIDILWKNIYVIIKKKKKKVFLIFKILMT